MSLSTLFGTIGVILLAIVFLIVTIEAIIELIKEKRYMPLVIFLLLVLGLISLILASIFKYY
ncbi:MAG: hypothetical protein E6528_06515 [Staphylococcus sp.]|nr:hypothetical protein [Staphylococcus sp.]